MVPTGRMAPVTGSHSFWSWSAIRPLRSQRRAATASASNWFHWLLRPSGYTKQTAGQSGSRIAAHSVVQKRSGGHPAGELVGTDERRWSRKVGEWLVSVLR